MLSGSDPGLLLFPGSLPAGRLSSFPGSPITARLLDQLVAAANA
jgi:hypothetical protein